MNTDKSGINRPYGEAFKETSRATRLDKPSFTPSKVTSVFQGKLILVILWLMAYWLTNGECLNSQGIDWVGKFSYSEIHANRTTGYFLRALQMIYETEIWAEI